jgi:hypothetical protein
MQYLRCFHIGGKCQVASCPVVFRTAACDIVAKAIKNTNLLKQLIPEVPGYGETVRHIIILAIRILVNM